MIPENVKNALGSGEIRSALERHLEPSVVEWVMDAIFMREHNELKRK